MSLRTPGLQITAFLTPDLRLPYQPQDICALHLVPNYTAWWQRNMRVNNLPKAGSRTRDHELQANALIITSPGQKYHTMTGIKLYCLTKGEQGCEQFAQSHYSDTSWVGVESSRLQVWCPIPYRCARVRVYMITIMILFTKLNNK